MMHKNKSVNVHQFAMVPQAEIPRSAFNRQFTHKTTLNSGYLYPIYADEVLPGDTFNLKMTAFVRMNTPIFPIMDNLHIDTFFFFVPNRLIWDNWKKFNGEQVNPGDSTSYVVPQVVSPAGGFAVGSLFDYFGLPTVGQVGGGNTISVANFHGRAYNLIWNEWFRDENLQNSLTVDKGDGPDTLSNYVLQRRGKRHDYFTSSLPWPQKGTSVSLPLGTVAPIKSDAVFDGTTNTNNLINVLNTAGQKRFLSSNSVGNAVYGGATSGGTGATLYADLSSATAATINQLRQSFQIQKLYERDARGGTRYTEIVRAHFGVVSPDARLQRPEYLGGGSSPIIINPVAQTSGTSASGTTTPLGNLAAVGTGLLRNHGFSQSFTEHGVILGLVSIRADLTYQQGIRRMWSRSTRFDFYWPVFAMLGEQAVLNKEIYADGSASDNDVFGYQERWAEYRYFPSQITGLFRSRAAGTLDGWHLAQNFTSRPTLNSTFIQDNPPVSRVIAVPSQPEFLFDSFFDLYSARPMPMYSVPGLIDHF